MHRIPFALEFEQRALALRSIPDLQDALQDATRAMGFRYFALLHHVDLVESPARPVRLHNYPVGFSAWFEANRLARHDPVHRACHRTNRGFGWNKVPALVRLSPSDLEIFDRARAEGIGDGYTVPAHIPGEARGSCSFAVADKDEVPGDWLPVVQLIGAIAFDTARRLNSPLGTLIDAAFRLTDRQRDCVVWAARGKTDWEIGKILGLSRETVRQHLKQARDRYGIPRRSQLAVWALAAGIISFSEVLDR